MAAHIDNFIMWRMKKISIKIIKCIIVPIGDMTGKQPVMRR